MQVRYLYQSVSKEELVALYRACDVMLVTPLRDGMNLVAKEFVASRTDLGGALVLSEFAGAADTSGLCRWLRCRTASPRAAGPCVASVAERCRSFRAQARRRSSAMPSSATRTGLPRPPASEYPIVPVVRAACRPAERGESVRRTLNRS